MCLRGWMETTKKNPAVRAHCMCDQCPQLLERKNLSAQIRLMKNTLQFKNHFWNNLPDKRASLGKTAFRGRRHAGAMPDKNCCVVHAQIYSTVCWYWRTKAPKFRWYAGKKNDRMEAGRLNLGNRFGCRLLPRQCSPCLQEGTALQMHRIHQLQQFLRQLKFEGDKHGNEWVGRHPTTLQTIVNRAGSANNTEQNYTCSLKRKKKPQRQPVTYLWGMCSTGPPPDGVESFCRSTQPAVGFSSLDGSLCADTATCKFHNIPHLLQTTRLLQDTSSQLYHGRVLFSMTQVRCVLAVQ